MADFYSAEQRQLQDAFGTRGLADALHGNVLRRALAPMDRKFIAASDFFFLSTVDHRGYPTVSYKGGFPGFVQMPDDRTLCFPVYDGNGMFLSAGNIAGTSKVGLLFIDFTQPRRLRLQGTASLVTDEAQLADVPEALMLVQVELEAIFTNCPRYIHGYQRTGSSEYVPADGANMPVPEWKRVDYLQEQLPPKDREAARKAGEVITEAEYRKHFWKGLE
ncbi:pyridoxamine 5'-phosphate oxidase family protein [Leisingera sp. ANG-M6]|uniref:pyridoxamine 5'-phosphate oxidase family protein n=1 Tax=Leisingera sp. ANG-M6 TaxID=1577900 RepID=UPI00057C39C3|nr:pyridoxamine 5'-phosphate oxidase family protein [Leisingera sp. ANG-M6]KIC29293.1 pyridoxamine 5'-phosphate oxidase [Leisingera sp. ANG-M6]